MAPVDSTTTKGGASCTETTVSTETAASAGTNMASPISFECKSMGGNKNQRKDTPNIAKVETSDQLNAQTGQQMEVSQSPEEESEMRREAVRRLVHKMFVAYTREQEAMVRDTDQCINQQKERNNQMEGHGQGDDKQKISTMDLQVNKEDQLQNSTIEIDTEAGQSTTQTVNRPPGQNEHAKCFIPRSNVYQLSPLAETFYPRSKEQQLPLYGQTSGLEGNALHQSASPEERQPHHTTHLQAQAGHPLLMDNFPVPSGRRYFAENFEGFTSTAVHPQFILPVGQPELFYSNQQPVARYYDQGSNWPVSPMATTGTGYYEDASQFHAHSLTVNGPLLQPPYDYMQTYHF